MAFTENLAAYFVDFGVDGTLAGAPVRGHFDSSSLVEDGDGVVTQAPSFLLPAPATAPAPGASLVLPSGSYTVRRTLAQPPDGALVRLVLTRA